MVAYYFSFKTALVKGSPNVVAANATVLIYDVTDTARATPVTAYSDPALTTVTNLVTDAYGIVPDFYTNNLPDVLWKSGTNKGQWATSQSRPGLRGATGAKGDTGPQGAQGNPGLNGAGTNGEVAAYIPATGPTRDALDARFYTKTANDTLLAGKVSKGAYAIFMDDYPTAGDGTTGGTTALQQAFTDAQGKTLVLGKEKTYTITSTISAPVNVNMISNGSKFVKNSIGYYAFITNSGFTTDLLDVQTPGHATTNDYGVSVAGSNLRISHLRVVSTQGDTPGNYGVTIGNGAAVNTTARTNVRIDRLEVTGFQRPVRVLNLADSCIANIDIRNFVVGVYLQNNVSNVTFPRATISGTSAASATGPYNGMNGLLVESVVDNNTQGLRFYDWTVDGAPEHSYRVGGSYSINDVTFTNCISRNPGNAPGNVSTGGGAFKCLGVVGHLHKNIRYVHCSATDSNTDANGVNNFSQFSFGYVDGLTLINPTVRARNKTYSAHIALYLNSVSNVHVVSPDFRDTKTFAVFIGKDGTDTPGVGVQNLKISGGLIHSATTHALWMDTQTTVTKEVDLENVKILGNATVARGVRTEAVGAGGAYTNVNLDLKYTLNATIGTEPALLLQPEMMLRYTGPVYGYSMSAANGSTMVNTTAGSFMLRKAGAWVTL